MTRNLVPRCMKYYSNRASQSIWVAWVTGDREGCMKILADNLCMCESELASALLVSVTGTNEHQRFIVKATVKSWCSSCRCYEGCKACKKLS